MARTGVDARLGHAKRSCQRCRNAHSCRPACRYPRSDTPRGWGGLRDRHAGDACGDHWRPEKAGLPDRPRQEHRPTQAGLTLHGILKQADPTLVDPGMAAQLECLLDDVLVGKQAMVGAIDAVCDVAQRIVGKLTQGPVVGGPPLLRSARGGSNDTRPPTSAMKRYADSIARQKRIRPPPGYTASLSICRAFLEQHAARKAGGRQAADPGDTKASPGIVGNEQSTCPEAPPGRGRGGWRPCAQKGGAWKEDRKVRAQWPGSQYVPSFCAARCRRQHAFEHPYGNKDVALELGARSATGGWYAPPGVDLSAFREKGWLAPRSNGSSPDTRSNAPRHR